MESKGTSDSKEDSKLIKCKNCRQDILASKMFLHEGFCQRNNKFCEHCGRVFLKKDYNNHLKNKDKKIKKEKKEDNNNLKEIRRINIYRSPIITKRRTAFEYIQMPMTEEYKINNPIIISEDGKIISNKNQNEYLLPYFGINSAKKNEVTNNEIVDNEYILNQTDLFKENNQVINDNGYKFEIDINKNMKNSVSMTNINPKIFGDNLFLGENIDKKEANLIDENNLKIDKNQHSSLLNNISLTEDDFMREKQLNSEKLNNDLDKINNNNNNNINNSDNKQNNSIIINNNIITYNANDNINKIHNIYNAKNKYKDKQFFENSNININTKQKDFLIGLPKENNITNFNPMRISSKDEIERFHQKFKKNLINNNIKLNVKEPNDSKSKQILENHKFAPYLLEKMPKNSPNKKLKIRPKPQSAEGKNIRKKKKMCEFCNSYVDDLVTHYQCYHEKNSTKVISPKKRDTALLNEKLDNMDTDEAGIDENNKKILMRELKPNMHVVSIDTENNNLQSAKVNKYSFIKQENIQKVNYNKLFNNEVNYIPKGFPQDSKIYEYLPRTQERKYKHRNYFEIKKDYNHQTENKSSKNKIAVNITKSPQFATSYINYSNNIYNPLYYFTESKKYNNYLSEGIINTSNVNYINVIDIQGNNSNNIF